MTARPRRTSPAPPLAQPEALRTTEYRYGVETVNGHDAWALFVACAAGDLVAVERLLARDPRLVNAQYWYQFPIHMAVRANHADVVRTLLARGADPGQSRFTYNSWDKLLACAKERGFRSMESLLERAMRRRFGYDPGFETLKTAIVNRDERRIAGLVRRQPELVAAADALGNNALHWSVLTRQPDLLRRFGAWGTPLDGLRADGLSPVTLAASGAMDYWYRANRGAAHPSLRNAAVLVGGLLALGAEYNLSVAAAVGDLERVQALLSRNPALAQQLDTARNSPLAYAARGGYRHIVKWLVEHGADPNRAEDLAPDGRALYEACCRNDFAMAELLLKHGANPNAGVDSCECCLTICRVYHGARARPLQELLRRHGAMTPPYALTTSQLRDALRRGDRVVEHEEFFDVILRKRDRQLLELYLDTQPSDRDLMNSWGCVDYPNSVAIVRSLLARGLNPLQRDWLGRTFLHTCAERGDRAIAAEFLKAGADINARDAEFDETPLATAIRCGELDTDGDQPQLAPRSHRLTELLLKRGAAVEILDAPAWSTPLSVARRRGLGGLTNELIRRGATR